MIDLKKIAFYIVAVASFFAVETISVTYISNTAISVIITAIVWFFIALVVVHYFSILKQKFDSRQFVVTDKKEAFNFSCDIDNNHFNGLISPSVDRRKDGFPQYFRVDLNSNFYACIVYKNGKWARKGGKVLIQPGEERLFQIVGKNIMDHYKIGQ
jgi:hypothetical protein